MSGLGAASACVVAALSLASAASAAYRPQLSVALDGPAPGRAAAITSTLTQPLGDSATKSIRVVFPRQFTFNPAFAVAGCAPLDESAGTCGDESRVGNASVETDVGTFAGPVHFTPDFRLVMYLRGVGGTIEQRVVVTFAVQPDGSIETAMDNLPDFPTSSGRIALDGGPKGVFLTPRSCGRYTLRTLLVSQADERAESELPLEIAGCPARPQITAASVRPHPLRAGRPATLRWHLSDPASRTRIAVQRLRRGSWWSHAVLRGAARQGENTLRLPGRLISSARQRLVLRAVSESGVGSLSHVVELRVRRRR